MQPLNNTEGSKVNYYENSLENAYSNQYTLETFITTLKTYFDNAKTMQEREAVVKSIEDIEKSIAEKDPSHAHTLLSQIIDKDPAFAIQYMSFFKASIDLEVNRRTVLIKCCEDKQVDVVKALVANGANLDKKDWLNRTALAVCIEFANTFVTSKEDDEIFDALVGGGCDVNVPVDLLKTPATLKCAKNMLSNWTWNLLQRNPDLNAKDNFGTQLIHQAIINHDQAMVSHLIKRKVELNSLAKNGWEIRKITPCHIAVIVNEPEILDMLVKNGADPYIRAESPHFEKHPEWEPISAFLMAADAGRQDCVNAIVKKKAPQPKDYQLGFIRTLSKPRGSHYNVSLMAEAAVQKSFASKVNIEGVNCFQPKNIATTLLDKYFTNVSTETASLYIPVWNMIKVYAKLEPNFTIVFSDKNDGSLCGVYNAETKTDIMVYFKEVYGDDLAATLIHEMTHKCAHLIYQNWNPAPFAPDSAELHQIQKEIEELKYAQSPHATVLKNKFQPVEEYYDSRQHPAEYIARIPQVILLLSHRYKLSSDQIRNCLQTYLPTLSDMYFNDFIPACEKYIAGNNG